MDKCTDQIFEFEQALKNNSSINRSLYTAPTTLFSKKYKIEDVILSVSKQITAMQSADSVNKQRQHYTCNFKSSGKGLLSNGVSKFNKISPIILRIHTDKKAYLCTPHFLI